MGTEVVYIGRDNAIDLLLTADGVATDLVAGNVSRIDLRLCQGSAEVQTISSTTAPTAFDWATAGATGRVILALGGLFTEPARYTAHLVVYDPDNTNGIEWGTFTLRVKDDC
jgi:hypothetical protein